jgi:glycosyltransferase involved in cell wall biosynthesis
MTIPFIVKSLETPGGGAERVFVEITSGLRTRGYDIEVVTFDPPGARSFYPLREDVPKHDLGPQSLHPVRLLALRRAILRMKPTQIVAFMPSSYVPTAFALLGSGAAVRASEHNVPARYRSAPAKWGVLNASVPAIDRFTAVSAQMKDAYPWWIRRKMTVVENPVSGTGTELADVFAFGRSKRLLAVGRLHPQKDHVTLIRAFAVIAETMPDWHLRILGEGDERSMLEHEIKRLGLAGRVEMPGAVLDMSAEYTAAQLYVIPSLYESQGLATVEAMAHGLPAVGFRDCPGTNSIIADGLNGILIDPHPNRPEALAQGLKAMMQDEQRRSSLALGALAHVPGPRLDAVLDDWEAFLES